MSEWLYLLVGRDAHGVAFGSNHQTHDDVVCGSEESDNAVIDRRAIGHVRRGRTVRCRGNVREGKAKGE